MGSGLVDRCAVEGAPEETLSQSYSCADCGTSLTEITPRLFSFNSPYGACPTCTGLGTLSGVDPEKVVADPERSIDAGALGALAARRPKSWRMSMVDDPRQGDGLLARRRRGASCPRRRAR